MLFVFEVELKAGYPAQAYAEAWMRASALIQQAPGARGTRLHRHLQDDRRLLAIARWASKSVRDAMESQQSEEVRRIIASQAEFVTIRVLGEYDEAEWRVDP